MRAGCVVVDCHPHVTGSRGRTLTAIHALLGPEAERSTHTSTHRLTPTFIVTQSRPPDRGEKHPAGHRLRWLSTALLPSNPQSSSPAIQPSLPTQPSNPVFQPSLPTQARLVPKRRSARFETQTAPESRDWLTGAGSEIANRRGKQLASNESTGGRLETRLFRLSCPVAVQRCRAHLSPLPSPVNRLARAPAGAHQPKHSPSRPPIGSRLQLHRATHPHQHSSQHAAQTSIVPCRSRGANKYHAARERLFGQCSSLHLNPPLPSSPFPSAQAGPPGRWPITTIPPFLSFGSAIPTDSLQSAQSFFHSFPCPPLHLSAGRNCSS
ncbi:hypothetical protein PMIN01_00788 [Paraphaeosphaeria minitans]|uniref:Uncharacterized protein n=1 Tax=Paraphaeosphaeria minitans TaxID=565426 RepID=A0A9P6KWR9_9PLEO|nr:hypothetical protein PMIN01_00788 [Paraphaeosphaeria minitans]